MLYSTFNIENVHILCNLLAFQKCICHKEINNMRERETTHFDHMQEQKKWKATFVVEHLPNVDTDDKQIKVTIEKLL